MTSRPTIGITCARETVAHGGSWRQPVDYVPTAYVAAVQRAGGRALLLPTDEGAAGDEAATLLRGLDGLLLIGGIDLAPESYGAERHPATAGDSPARDRFEIALVRAAEQQDLPLLAVCRGMQVVNVAGGGTLLQHLPESLGSERHRRVAGTLDERNAHEVRLEPESLAARAAGGARAAVRSHHHQAVDHVAPGWRVTGHASDDELIEAIERPDRRFCLAVQWHPEGDPASGVIAALVDAAREAGVGSGVADAGSGDR